MPALDGIELALEAGRSLLARRRHELADARARHVAAQRDWDTAQARGMATASSPPIRTSGVWDRLRRSLAGDSAPAQPSLATPALLPPAPPAELDLASELVDATRSWLSGLELVRERFAALLALEAIQPLPALGQPFDPRLHLAIEAETRSDVPANTVVRVLRQGYRQRQRVLRYAEVVVARAPVDSEPEPDPVHPEENDHES